MKSYHDRRTTMNPQQRFLESWRHAMRVWMNAHGIEAQTGNSPDNLTPEQVTELKLYQAKFEHNQYYQLVRRTQRDLGINLSP
jgi:hypothetical protein